MDQGIDGSRRRACRIIASSVVTAAAGLPGGTNAFVTGPADGGLPALRQANAWLNAPPLVPDALRGKVVLVQFWTYSCINWMRTLPYVRAWAARYRDDGLVVIGVHTPEFDFEKELGNVRRAVKEMAIDYPVAIDSDRRIWQAFSNDYWPALYFIDAKGQIRDHKFGEGDYEKSESIIQALLAESGSGDPGRKLARVNAGGREAAADWADLKSPENYLGYGRTDNFASPGGLSPDAPRLYATPPRLRLNQWALAGGWTVGKQPAVANASNGRIACRFHARDLHMVLGPGPGAAPVRFRVLLDDMPPGASRGLDVDSHGNGIIAVPRLYQLVRQAPPIIRDRLFTIEFLQPHVEAYAFTFG